MMKCIVCLYDRILANRLKLWLPFNSDQTAFQKGKSILIQKGKSTLIQKGKSTLIHIFTLRLIIEIVNKKEN